MYRRPAAGRRLRGLAEDHLPPAGHHPGPLRPDQRRPSGVHKGGFSQGGFGNFIRFPCAIVIHSVPCLMCKLKTRLIAKPPFTKPPFVNSGGLPAPWGQGKPLADAPAAEAEKAEA